MNCRNCGAPMTLYRENEYFFCEYCGSFHFPSASRDGVRLLGVAPGEIKCPACRDILFLASFNERPQGYQCRRCQGILLDRATFAEVVQARRAWASQPPDPPRPVNPKALKRRLRCPLCQRTMDTFLYYGPGNIVIDTCHTCHVIWLDYGELGRAVNAPGRDRGAALLERARREDGGLADGTDGSEKREGGGIDLLDLVRVIFS
ncbi:MAG: zf-TFIIB domain-containing protein [Anaerolineae bacterium]|nr:zf-TFIIB domain-containing protein [Anaerolineae bacterium]